MMYRTTLSRAARQAVRTASQRRSASTATEAASKLKDAAANLSPAHHKPSSDVPWAVGSLLVFAPLLFYMTSPPGEYHHHEKKGLRKYEIRMPDPDAQHYTIPEGKEDIGGEGTEHKEGDHQLREMTEDNDHKVMDQKSPTGDGNSDNYTGKSGLKGDAEKFKAASRAQTQLFQEGGGEALRNPKLAVQLAREASEQAAKGETKKGGPVEEAHGDTDTPASTSDLVKETLEDKKDENAE